MEALMFGISYLKLGLGLGVAILVALAAFGIKAGINKIDAQGRQISQLKTDLATEKQARERDVRGLTVLSQGITAAASARAIDEKILGETINASNPKPVSPDLGRFLDGLRSADAPPAKPGPAGGTDKGPRR
jgi:hypothetical protein